MSNPKYKMTISSEGENWGEIILETFPETAPLHAANFDELVKSKSYDGCAFHRVIPGFMIQGGDPNSISGPKEKWGMGSPSQKKVQAEFSMLQHKRGILSAARSSHPDSASSQFFICTSDALFLDGQYSVFGQVTEGMDIADKIVTSPRDARDNPHKKIEMRIEKIEEENE